MVASPQRSIQDSPPGTYGFRKSCEAVRKAVPVDEIARRYTELERYGGRAWFMGRCPLPDHEDRTASFYVYPNEIGSRWWCYGCSRGGDMVDLEFFCGDYGELWEAMIALAVEHNVELPRRPRGWHGWQGKKVRRLNGMRDVLAQSYRRRLFRIYRDYLAGIEDPHEREEEARAIWDDLALLARGCAELRMTQRAAA